MPIILQTDNFIVKGHDQPHHHRQNGGHAVVSPINRYSDRTEMPLKLYTGLMQLVMLTGEAITTVLRSKGIDVVRINYQDNGNWAYFPIMHKPPHVHIHLYVRSKQEVHPSGDKRFQAFPNALFFPFILEHPEYYRDFEAYTTQDCDDFRSEIDKLLASDKYQGVREMV